MSNFERVFDDFMGRARNMYGVASKATSDVVDMGKIRYQIKQAKWDIEKTYAKLGSVVYEMRKGAENLDDVVTLAVAEIDSLGERVEELEKQLRTYKRLGKCESCGAENDVEASYCSKCGSKIERNTEPPQTYSANPPQAPQDETTQQEEQ